MDQRKHKIPDKHDLKKRVERKRYLNIIYFVDSRRTRTLKYSIERSYLTVAIIAASMLWSVVSTALLLRDRIVIREMTDHSEKLLGLVFNYQTRYDEVYEKAYPARESAPQMVSDSYVEEEPEKEEESKQEQVADDNPKPKVASLAAKVDKVEIPISVDNFSTQLSDTSLTARLSLKNLNSPTKTEGTITASAKFVDTDNVPSTLQSVPQPTEDGPATDHFNIRYFKNRSFLFEIPDGKVGKFLSVTVTLRDGQGRKREFLYALNKESAPAQARAERTEKSRGEDAGKK
jgi:hypothetical protein